MAGRLAATPSDTVRVACVGLKSRGSHHLSAYSKLPNVEIAALCDIDESVLNRATAAVERRSGKRPAGYADFRKLLEDHSIDAVSIATPNHSHTVQTVWACQAGKDVYIEKPCAHNMFEARQIVAAARKYDRIVQQGSQSRSSPALQEAAQKMREGLIGDVYMARGLCFKVRDTIGRAAVEAVPAGVDYDLWLGPAPQNAVHQKSLPLQLALVLGLRQRRPGQPGHPRTGHRAMGPGRHLPHQGQRHRRPFHVR